MLLRECLSNWPPITISEQKNTLPPLADLRDTVVDIKNLGSGDLEIRLRRTKHFEYTIVVRVPTFLRERIIFDILRYEEPTLHDVGNLRVS